MVVRVLDHDLLPDRHVRLRRWGRRRRRESASGCEVVLLACEVTVQGWGQGDGAKVLGSGVGIRVLDQGVGIGVFVGVRLGVRVEVEARVVCLPVKSADEWATCLQLGQPEW